MTKKLHLTESSAKSGWDFEIQVWGIFEHLTDSLDFSDLIDTIKCDTTNASYPRRLLLMEYIFPEISHRKQLWMEKGEFQGESERASDGWELGVLIFFFWYRDILQLYYMQCECECERDQDA